MYERKHERVAPTSVFAKRMAVTLMMTAILILAALSVGISGYLWFAGFGWLDSLVEASMILGGMGPVQQLTTSSGKWFASGYALFSGLIFIAVMGLVLAPVIHRILHRFHEDEKDLEN